MAIFIIAFMVLFFILYRLLYTSFVVDYLHPEIIHVTAYLPYLIMKGFGEKISFINHSLLVSRDFTLKVIIDCCAIEPVLIFTSAVVSFPSTLKKKLLGILIAIPVFFMLNVVRIVSLYFVGATYGLKAMERLHLDVWQVILILLSVTFFLLWLRWQPAKKSRQT